MILIGGKVDRLISMVFLLTYDLLKGNDVHQLNFHKEYVILYED